MPTFFIVPPRKTQLGEFGFSVSGILGIKTDLPNNAPITSSGSLLLDTSFSPTWTGVHNFNNTVNFNGNVVFNGQSIDSTAFNVPGQTTGDLLYYNGSDWTRFAVGGTSGMVLQSTGSNLSWSKSLNVSTTVTSSLSIGSLNGVLKASSGVVSGNSGLGDLNDVALSSPSDTQFLKFNSTSNKWVNSLLPLPDRALIIRFLNGVTPVSLGPDQEVAIVPFDPSDGVSALVFRVVRIIFQVEDFSATEDSIVSIQITGAGQPFPDPTAPEAVFLATLTLPAGEREVFINRANTPTFNENLNSGQEVRLIIDAIGTGASGWTVQIECSTVSVNTTIGFGGILPISSGGTGRGTLGESNQILAVDSTGSKLVYKTLQPGSNVTITQTPAYVDGVEVTGTITIAATGGSGGGGTVNSGTANRVAYYSASSSTIDSATHLQWDDTSNRLKISSGPPTWSTTTVSVLVGNDFSNGDANGTVYGANISSGFGGNFADYKLNNVSKFAVSSAGEVTTQKLNLGSNTASTGTTSGALVVTGGVGIGGALNLGTQLSVPNGGTGVTSATSGQLLIGNTSGTFTLSTITAGSGISVTNGNGSITVAATGLASLNSLTGTSQTFAVGTSGSDFGITSTSTTHTFNLPDAGTSARGVVSTSSQSFAGQKTFSSSAVSQKFYTGSDGYFGGDPSVFTYTGTTGSIQFGIKKSDDITHFAGIKIIEKTSPTLGSGYLYGDIVFYTDAEGEELSTERLRIDGAGLITAKKDVTIEGTLSLTNHPLATSYGGTGLSTLGTSNSLLGVNNGASGLEYKTLTAGSNVTITHSTSSITISAASPGSSGITSLNTVTGSTQTFVNDTNVTVVSSSVANTHTITWSGQLGTSRGGTGLGTIGTSNSLLGVNNGASGLEYKTLTAGSNVTITHGTNAITISAASPGSSGITSLNTVTGSTQTFVNDTNVTVVSSSVANTHTITWSGELGTSRGGTGLGTLGTSNSLLGVNNGASGLEYKTLTAGSNVTITHGTNSITISAASPGSSGITSLNTVTGSTQTFVNDTNVTVVSSSVANTHTITWSGELSVSRGGTGTSSITGLVKGSGTSAFTAASSGVDYAPPTSGASLLYGNNAGGFSNVTVSTGLSFSGGTLSNTGVTSVGLSLPNIFTLSTSTVTTTGTLTATLSTTSANYVFAGPTTGSATTPAFRALVAADIPSLNYAPQTTGTSILYGNNAGGFSNVTVSTGLSFSGGTLSNTGVTSVGLSLPNIFTISTSTVTTTGTLTATLSTTSANYVFAGPTTGSATTPAFRALVAADIPSLNYAPQTTGSSLLYGNNAGGFSNATVSTGLSFSGGTLSNTGVTSVGLSLPNIFTVSTSTVTTTGTLTATLAATSANYVLAGPTTGSATTPAFRALVAADIPSLDASKITSGTIATARLATGTATTTTFLRGDQTWATVSGGSPAGSNGQIQFNNASSFGGATYASWNTTNNSFNLSATPTATSISAVLQIGSAFTAETPALGDFTGSTSGTIIAVNTATSFVGNQIDLQNFGSSIFKVDYSGKTTIAATTASTSSTTGALVVSGGAGIGQSLYVGGNLYQNSNAITAYNTGFRNRIINGDGNIDQRNSAASTTPSSTSNFIDRWKMNINGSGRLTVGKNYGGVASPDGFISYIGMKTTTTTSPGAGDYNFLSHVIEGTNTIDFQWGTANAKTVTLSFWAYSSLTGTFGGSVRNHGTFNRSYPFTYTISASNTWEKKTIVIPGDTSGTWTNDHLNGIEFIFVIANGSTFQGTASTWASANYHGPSGSLVNLIGTLNATLYLTGIQVEIGSVATPYERRNYGHEFSLCQRYYQITEVRTGGYNTTGGGLRGSAYLNTAARPISSPVLTVLSTDESVNLGSLTVDSSNFRGDSFRFITSVTTAGDAYGQWKVSCDTEF